MVLCEPFSIFFGYFYINVTQKHQILAQVLKVDEENQMIRLRATLDRMRPRFLLTTRR